MVLYPGVCWRPCTPSPLTGGATEQQVHRLVEQLPRPVPASCPSIRASALQAGLHPPVYRRQRENESAPHEPRPHAGTESLRECHKSRGKLNGSRYYLLNF